MLRTLGLRGRWPSDCNPPPTLRNPERPCRRGVGQLGGKHYYVLDSHEDAEETLVPPQLIDALRVVALCEEDLYFLYHNSAASEASTVINVRNERAMLVRLRRCSLITMSPLYPHHDCGRILGKLDAPRPVSYTHLTLPTILLV